MEAGHNKNNYNNYEGTMTFDLYIELEVKQELS
jgi:hypothetical protein